MSDDESSKDGVRAMFDLPEPSDPIGPLIDRTEFIYPYRYLSVVPKRAADDSSQHEDIVNDEAQTVRIACISPRIDLAEGPDGVAPDLSFKQFDDEYCLLLGDRAPFEVWRKERLHELEAALENGPTPDIICFSELSYPPSRHPGSQHEEPDRFSTEKLPRVEQDAVVPRSDPEPWRAWVIREEMKARIAFDGQVENLLEGAGSPFAFLGSYHCIQTYYNVGVIYPWGKSHSLDIQETTRHSPKASTNRLRIPLLHRKRYPARSIGERTKVPNSRNMDIYKTKYGNIAVLICSDVVDLNQFMSLVRINLGEVRAGVDIILVPSLNCTRAKKRPQDPFEEMCRSLSDMTGALVCMVNVNPENPLYPDSKLFLHGQDISKADDGDPEAAVTFDGHVEVEHQRTKSHGGVYKTRIEFYKVNRKIFRRKKEDFLERLRKAYPIDATKMLTARRSA